MIHQICGLNPLAFINPGFFFLFNLSSKNYTVCKINDPEFYYRFQMRFVILHIKPLTDSLPYIIPKPCGGRLCIVVNTWVVYVGNIDFFFFYRPLSSMFFCSSCSTESISRWNMTVHRLGSLGVLRDNSFVMFGMFLPLSLMFCCSSCSPQGFKD